MIVEGPDCSGKDTLVQRIKNRLRWDSKALHHIKGDQFERYLKEYVLGNKTVFNRSHFSEIVYSILWRNGSPFSKEEEKILEDLVLLSSVVVFVCPEIDILKSRYISRDFDQQIKLSELEKSREIFCSIFKKMNCIFYFSKSYDELEFIVDKICSIIEGESL